MITKARIGQHRFARGVLDNCGWSCLFCGFTLGTEVTGHLLRASHIKPWRDSAWKERTDPRNGIAACPTHDAAFDAGLIGLGLDQRIVVSGRLRRAAATNHAVWTAFSPPVLRERLSESALAAPLGMDYTHWHRTVVFTD
ncbi:HNH endonuclease [Actinotalea sp. C106]|uniref:HNH endonuclease n=1 Tax=Actinotalea sp. C106 TaxID=2908644 RepID=UPI0020281643|nr:HNH endonuclease [Actinotalea sp. C106]